MTIEIEKEKRAQRKDMDPSQKRVMRSVDVFRGILHMISKRSHKKFEVLKQVESGLNVNKAFVLWKHNAEVQNIDQSLES